MFYLFISHLIFRLNCPDWLLVCVSSPPHPSVYPYCCHVDSVQWWTSLMIYGHTPVILCSSQQRDCYRNLELQFWSRWKFFRAGFPKSCSLTWKIFKPFQLEIRAWPLRCTYFFGREEKLHCWVPKELMHCFRFCLMLITAVHLWQFTWAEWTGRRYVWCEPLSRMFALSVTAWDGWHFKWWMVDPLKSMSPFVLSSQLFLILQKICKKFCYSLEFIFLLRVPCPHPLWSSWVAVYFFFKCISNLSKFNYAPRGTGSSSQLGVLLKICSLFYYPGPCCFWQLLFVGDEEEERWMKNIHSSIIFYLWKVHSDGNIFVVVSSSSSVFPS